MRSGLSALVVVLLLLPASSARAYDPQTRWQTLSTPHFRFHYPLELHDQAQVAARAAEKSYGEVTLRLDWIPTGLTDIVLADETDSANGFARVLPYRLVGLNAVAPEDLSDLSFFENWLEDLLTHELVHIVHLDTIHGIPSWVNRVFGRVMAPNGEQPRWFIEGLATYYESALSTAGRVRSSYFDMFMRMAILENQLLSLGEISGITWRWPQGSIPYLYGGRFLDSIAKRHGESALSAISHDYSARLFPWALNLSAKRATGENYLSLYNHFEEDLRVRYNSQRDRIEQQGLVEGQRLTTRGQDVRSARWAPDGSLYYVVESLGEHAFLERRLADGTLQFVEEVEAGTDLSLSSDGTFALLSERQVYRTYRRYNDLFRIDLRTGHKTRLSSGLRPRDVDLSHDGQWVVFAQNDGSHSVVRLAPYGDLQQACLGRFGALFARVESAIFTGRTQSRFLDCQGQRDLYCVDIAEGQIRQLTDDGAVEGGRCLPVMVSQ
ncbi:MAG: hypothetical protein R3C68_19550 [Myxococcota bacterium]